MTIAKIKLGPINYSLSSQEDLHDSDGGKIDGTGHASYAKVVIEESKIDDRMKLVVLLHEFIHMIFIHAGRFENSKDEGMIDALSYGMADILIRNFPVITKFVGLAQAE